MFTKIGVRSVKIISKSQWGQFLNNPNLCWKILLVLLGMSKQNTNFKNLAPSRLENKFKLSTPFQLKSQFFSTQD